MLRMLQVPELQRAMGFDPGFILDKGARQDRVRLLGNGVSPLVMKAVVGSLSGAQALCGPGQFFLTKFFLQWRLIDPV